MEAISLAPPIAPNVPVRYSALHNYVNLDDCPAPPSVCTFIQNLPATILSV